MDLVTRGLSTGSRMLDRMLLHGRDTVLTSENVYFLPYVPTPEEHFYRQDPGEAGMLLRPSLMLHITDQEFSLEVLDALADLGRNVLAGRAVLRDHPLNMSTGVFMSFQYDHILFDHGSPQFRQHEAYSLFCKWETLST